MTDYVLRADNQQAMYEAYAQVGILNDEGEPREAGNLPDGGSWAMCDVGEVEDRTGYWCILRWNSQTPAPPLPPEVVIEWSSEDDVPYPDGLPRFA